MRILFVSDTYYPHLNGVYYFVCRLAPLLKEKGHQVAVIAPSSTFRFSRSVVDGLDVYGMPSVPVIYYPNVRVPIPMFMKHKILRILNEFHPDIIHIQDHFSIAKLIVEVTKNLGVPVMGTNHFMTENLTAYVRSEKWRRKLSVFFWSKFSKVFNQVVLVTTPTETAARLIRPKLKTEVIPISSGIDLNSFSPEGDTHVVREKYEIPDKPVLLFVGRLDPEKNIEEILDAVAVAVKKIDFYFVIVGRGVRKSALERYSKKLKIFDRVIFTGFVPDEDLPFIYKLSRCFIISSIAELLSLGVLQGMASGLPVIAVKMGALVELVHDGVNGYLYDPGDIEMIVQSILRIFNMDDIYRFMSEKSLEYCHDHDINKTVRSFEKIYEIVCSKPGTAAVAHTDLSFA